jgi:hypothetical protein
MEVLEVEKKNKEKDSMMRLNEEVREREAYL